MEKKTYWEPGISLEEIERHAIIGALEHFSGNRTHAAEELGVSLRTIRNKIVQYEAQGFEVPRPEHNPYRPLCSKCKERACG